MSDNIDITVIEQPIAVTQAITETPVNIAIAVTDAPLDVNIAVDENTLSVAVAVTESPVAVTVSTVQGIEEAPVDGETYGRKDAGWVPVTVTETDPVFAASEAALFATGDKAKLDGIEPGAQVNDPETDPIFAASAAASILLSDITNWNSKLSVESDPIFLASVAASITLGDITNWNAKQDALGFTPVDSASANWLALISGGETALHSHAGGGGGVWGSITGILSNQTDLQTALNAKQNTLTLPLSPANGGTGVNNAGTLTNASNTTITGGGTVALGGFTLTVPATMTSAGRNVENTFTEIQKLTETTIAKGNGMIITGAGGNLIGFHSLDSGGVTFSFYSTNRFYGGASGWNATGFYLARAGGSLQVENDELKFYQFAAGVASSNSLVFTVPSGGGLRVGSVASPVLTVSSSGALTIVNDQWHLSKDAKKRIYFGNNSTTYFGSQAGYVWRNSSDSIDLLTISNLGAITQVATTTTTNAVMETLRLQAIVSSTQGAAGFGVSQTFFAETATGGTNQQQGEINTSWIDATNASRKAKMSLSAYDTAVRLGIEIQASGTEAMLGFYGVTPIARAILATGTGKTVDDVITALQNLGLVKQS